MAKPTEEQKKEFKRLFDFPTAFYSFGWATFERANLIEAIIDGKKEPSLIQRTSHKSHNCE